MAGPGIWMASLWGRREYVHERDKEEEMGKGSRGYRRRFRCWEFWAALAAVVFDVVLFVVPLFALLFLLALFQPQGWRWMAWATEVLRRLQEA